MLWTIGSSNLYGIVLLAQLSWSIETLEPTTKNQEATRASILFLEALDQGQADILAGLGTDPFIFDGRLVKTRTEINNFWQQLLKKHSGELDRQTKARLSIVNYQTAVAKFGRPPKSWVYLNLRKCKFAIVTFEKRNGMLLILQKSGRDSWRVAGVTD